MRLSAQEKEVIIKSILAFDPDAEIYLYGSRVDDTKKGGDIDLLIFSNTISTEQKRKIRRLICDEIGEQKIDLLIANDATSPFVVKAKKHGEKLQ